LCAADSSDQEEYSSAFNVVRRTDQRQPGTGSYTIEASGYPKTWILKRPDLDG
jgi:hypothetical protein